MPKLSIVVPTLNCIDLLGAHLDSMRDWLRIADEVVVVDSYSDDGTPQYIRKHLRHPNVRLLSHPRGLYQSWNFGISQTAGDWVYISTVGDRISRSLLQHLCELGESLKSDVVASRPTFVNLDGTPASRQIWPIDHILKSSSGRNPVRLSGAEAFLIALHCVPCAVLGSSASNVYRGEHIRARPFPTDFGTTGDTAWTLLHGFTTTYAFTPRLGSFFRLHPKAYAPSAYAVDDLNGKHLRLAAETLQSAEAVPELAMAICRLNIRPTLAAIEAALRLRSRPSAAAAPTCSTRA